MSREVIIGIIQADYGIDPIENYRKTRNLIVENYSSADIVILPEYSMVDPLSGLSPEQLYSLAETLEDSTYLSKITDLSGSAGAPILAHFIEKTGVKPLSRSTSVIVYPSGRIERVYSKIHLFDAYGYRESIYFLKGDNLSKQLVINNVKTFVAICFDIRYPELFRTYAREGAELVIVQSGWVRGPVKEEALEFLAKSRAHENTVWLAVANRFGKNYTGRSMVIDPLGIKVYELGIGEKYGEYAMNIEQLKEARRIIPILDKSIENWDIVFKG